MTKASSYPEIRNIYCVGRNYASFANEMGNALTEKPIIFIKPTHSLVPMNGNTLCLSGTHGEINCEAELVLHIGKQYEQGMRVEELIDQFTVGIDFTYRNTLNEVKKKGQPWLPAKGFKSSCTVGRFRDFSEEEIERSDFKMIKNGETLQIGNVKNMIFSLQTLVDFIAQNYGLGAGDLIYTGTPEGIGKLQQDDRIEIVWDEETIGSCKIELKS